MKKVGKIKYVKNAFLFKKRLNFTSVSGYATSSGRTCLYRPVHIRDSGSYGDHGPAAAA